MTRGILCRFRTYSYEEQLDAAQPVNFGFKMFRAMQIDTTGSVGLARNSEVKRPQWNRKTITFRAPQCVDGVFRQFEMIQYIQFFFRRKYSRGTFCPFLKQSTREIRKRPPLHAPTGKHLPRKITKGRIISIRTIYFMIINNIIIYCFIL